MDAIYANDGEAKVEPHIIKRRKMKDSYAKVERLMNVEAVIIKRHKCWSVMQMKERLRERQASHRGEK